MQIIKFNLTDVFNASTIATQQCINTYSITDCTTVDCTTVDCSTVNCNTVNCTTVNCTTIQCNTVKCSRCGTTNDGHCDCNEKDG